jgi:hypothetical protein
MIMCPALSAASTQIKEDDKNLFQPSADITFLLKMRLT